MSPALEDLIIKLTKKGLCEEQIYIQLTESQKVSEAFTLEDIYRSLAKYRAGVAMAGHDTGKKVYTRMWGVIVLLIGLILFAGVCLVLWTGSFPSPGLAIATCFMLFAGFTLVFKPYNRFNKLD